VGVTRGKLARSLRDPEVAEVYFQALGQLVLFPGARWRDERYVYAEVPSRLVRRRAVAEATRRWAARDLGITPPPMRFFVPIDLAAACGATWVAFPFDRRVFGLAQLDRGDIWIDARLSRRALVEVVAHEVKHIALGNCADSPSVQTHLENEHEARRYGRRVARGRVARRAGLERQRRHTAYHQSSTPHSTEPYPGNRAESLRS
jgi:hypothetical protein